jgi:hypothetical protein
LGCQDRSPLSWPSDLAVSCSFSKQKSATKGNAFLELDKETLSYLPAVELQKNTPKSGDLLLLASGCPNLKFVTGKISGILGYFKLHVEYGKPFVGTIVGTKQ